MDRFDSEFTAYFTARAAALRRLAFVLCGDWHTADDLVQQTFVKLYRRWRTVERGSVDPYTRRILVNTFLSHRRDRRRETVVAEVPDWPDAERDPGSRADIARALRSLSPQHRAVVVLRHLEDLSVAEVAEILGLAEGTVKSQTARGVDALRRALGAPVEMKD
jgi:RNA polymerase sigma-70 factor (sigma-E family)